MVQRTPDDMYDCEVRVRFVEGGEKVWRWVVRSCETLDTGVQREIRCRHCSGAVRVHKQQVEHGPADHVEHVRRHDSENCKGGTYFKGTHRVSDQPVV